MQNIGQDPAGDKPESAATPDTMPAPPARPLTSKELLAAEIERRHAAAREAARKAAEDGPLLPPSPAPPEAVSTARAHGHAQTITATNLPLSARQVLHLSAANPKVWTADLRRVPPPPGAESWLGRVRTLARARVTGDPLAWSLGRIAELILWATRKGGAGFARVTLASLANLAGCCRETARRCVRWLEDAGALDTFNVITRREDGQVRRDANAYIMRGDSGPAASPDEAPPLRVGTVTPRLRRYAAMFGLIASEWGLQSPRRWRGAT